MNFNDMFKKTFGELRTMHALWDESDTKDRASLLVLGVTARNWKRRYLAERSAISNIWRVTPTPSKVDGVLLRANDIREENMKRSYVPDGKWPATPPKEKRVAAPRQLELPIVEKPVDHDLLTKLVEATEKQNADVEQVVSVLRAINETLGRLAEAWRPRS
jgi:hypothetical protein